MKVLFKVTLLLWVCMLVECSPLLHLNETSKEMNERTKRLTFADDFTAADKLQELRSWWESTVSHGPHIDYHPKASKIWLTVKEQSCHDVINILEDNGVKIAVKDRR